MLIQQDWMLAGHKVRIRDLDGIPWDAAIVLLEQVVDRLDRNLPITDPRLKRYRVTLPSQ
ncbi:MAG: hypothetical protein ACO1SX_23605 [Actinomycetota bacterium]